MLEIGIIICIAVLLILALRHYSDEEKTEGEKMGIFDKFKKTGSVGIEEAITKGQETVVSPADLNRAQKGFSEEDPEIAHLLLKAEDAFLQNDYRSAEENAIEALNKEKKCGQAYVIMGKIAYARNSFADATECFQTALKCNDELAEAYYGLGEIYLKDENYTESIANFQNAVNIERNNPEWQAKLGNVYMEVRQFAKASKCFKKAWNLDFENKEYKDLANEAENKIRAHSSVYRFK